MVYGKERLPMSETVYCRIIVLTIAIVTMLVRLLGDRHQATRFIHDKDPRSDRLSVIAYAGLFVWCVQLLGRDPFAFVVPATLVPQINLAAIITALMASVLITWPRFMKERRRVWSGPFTPIKDIPGHRLITWGPYRFIRHPFYAGMLLGALAIQLTCLSWVTVAMFALLVPFHFGLNAEEDRMKSVYGPEYANYKTRTWRLLPPIY
jgi:protein-S-isoprenylcysteine O-methyltransferase Ste14